MASSGRSAKFLKEQAIGQIIDSTEWSGEFAEALEYLALSIDGVSGGGIVYASTNQLREIAKRIKPVPEPESE